MIQDNFYDFFNQFGISWLVLGFLYACFDFFFNLIMCQFVGGILQIQKGNKTRKRKFHLFDYILNRKSWATTLRHFFMGGNKLTREFLSDKLSWIWPITILAIPTILLGFSKTTIESANASLQKITINFGGYSSLFYQEYIQFLLWGIAFLISAGTFYRYQRQRSKTTWFSKHWGFNLLRTMLFDFPLSYMILATILIWTEFSLSLYRFLSDNNVYSFLHPDMMYGLKTVYKTVLSMGGALTVLSFLPTIMLIREKREKYSKIYFILVYSGMIALFIMFGLLVFRFDQRLGNIKESALNATQKQMITDQAGGDFQKVITDLQYYQIASSLPSGFPIPPWANTLLSVRSIVLAFETIKLSYREFTKEALIKFLRSLIKV